VDVNFPFTASQGPAMPALAITAFTNEVSLATVAAAAAKASLEVISETMGMIEPFFFEVFSNADKGQRCRRLTASDATFSRDACLRPSMKTLEAPLTSRACAIICPIPGPMSAHARIYGYATRT
jgi:hypothetical protein